jgi:uncharacterized SAM-binding protein YcdF (DUF218 family)
MDMFLFILKKVVARILFPIGLCLSLGILGVILWLARPRRRMGPALVVIAGLLLYAFSIPFVAVSLITPLEKIAGAYAQPSELERREIKWIVVLGGGQRNSILTPADQCDGDTTLRVLEGVRLWKGLPGARLVFSGGTLGDEIPTAQAMAALASQLGVPRGSMELEAASWDTSDQARILSAKFGRAPFALVTSASHMFRSLLLFQAHGSRPTPAPCDFSALPGKGIGWFYFIPQAKMLSISERAIYEYIGLLYFKFRSILGIEGGVNPRPEPAAHERKSG